MWVMMKLRKDFARGIMLEVRQEEREKRYVVCMYYGCEKCMGNLERDW